MRVQIGSAEVKNSRESTHRVILIGASNLTLCFPLVVNSLMNSLPEPLEIFSAHGHGRSFCQWSYVLHRGLPSVLDCGLWQELAVRPPVENTWALLMDAGNDLIYGVGIERLLARFEETLNRLSGCSAGISYLRLPLERVMMLSDFSYRITKKLLFPGPVLPWPIMSQRAIEFDEAATQLARNRGATVLTPRLNWYGIDPIHIRRSQRRGAWQEIFETWTFQDVPNVVPASARFAMKLWNCPPAERSFWKRPRLTPQPVLHLPEQLTLWLY